eukprot:532522-Prymnesium_polylepis.1
MDQARGDASVRPLLEFHAIPMLHALHDTRRAALRRSWGRAVCAWSGRDSRVSSSGLRLKSRWPR